MSTTDLILIALLLLAAACFAYVYMGAKRLSRSHDARVAAETTDAPQAAAPARAAAPPAAPPAAPSAPVPADGTAPSAASPFLAAPDGSPDDLLLIKGIGPKLSTRLAELGVFHFRQIAEWTPAQLSEVDAALGQFQGRPLRDQWQAQARLLASGDRKAFERAHGKLETPLPPPPSEPA